MSIQLNDCDRTRCEVWCRVMGYYRPVEAWNVGKKSEFAERVNFSESVGLSRLDDHKVIEFTVEDEHEEVQARTAV